MPLARRRTPGRRRVQPASATDTPPPVGTPRRSTEGPFRGKRPTHGTGTAEGPRSSTKPLVDRRASDCTVGNKLAGAARLAAATRLDSDWTGQRGRIQVQLGRPAGASRTVNR